MCTKIITRVLGLCTVFVSSFVIATTSYASVRKDIGQKKSCEKSLGVESQDSGTFTSDPTSLKSGDNSRFSLQDRIAQYQPYGPRGFVIGSDAKTAIEIADSVDAGLGAGYFQWVQSTYVVNRKLVLDRMAKDKADGIFRNKSILVSLKSEIKFLLR